MSEKLDAIVQQVAELNVLELSELIKAIEDKFGVSAAMPMAMAAMPAAGGAAAAAGGAAAAIVYNSANPSTGTPDDLIVMSVDDNPTIPEIGRASCRERV